MRTQAEWKVDTTIAFTAPPTRTWRRSFISRAALLVKVIARIAVGGTPQSRTRWAIRWVSTRVLPDPAPATIRVGPSVASTAWRWASFNPSSSSGDAAWCSRGRAEASIATEYTGARYDPDPRTRWPAFRGANLARLGRILDCSAVLAVGLAREGAGGLAGDVGQQVRQLHGQHELGRRGRADLLQRLQVLEAHGVGVDALGHLEDLAQRQREAFGAQDRRLAVPLGRHLPGHRLLDLWRRDDLADLDVGDLDSPAFGDVVELGAEGLVHLLALGEHVVEVHVADHAPQGGRGDVLRCAGEVLHLHHAHDRVHHPGEDDEVDRDGGVVLGDRRLLGDLQVLLPQVDHDRPVDDRDQQDQARPTGADHVAQPEQHDPLVLTNDPDGVAHQ